MTNDEINKYIATEIMGLCRHGDFRKSQSGHKTCGLCNLPEHTTNRHSYSLNNPDYCSDASPRSLLNEVVAKVGTSEVSLFLRAAPACINSTALELATACYASHRHMRRLKTRARETAMDKRDEVIIEAAREFLTLHEPGDDALAMMADFALSREAELRRQIADELQELRSNVADVEFLQGRLDIFEEQIRGKQ